MEVTEHLRAAVIARCPVQIDHKQAAAILELIDLSSAETARRLKDDIAQTRKLQERLHLRVQHQESILAESKRYQQGLQDGMRTARNDSIETAKKIRTMEKRIAIYRERMRAMREVIKNHVNPGSMP